MSQLITRVAAAAVLFSGAAVLATTTRTADAAERPAPVPAHVTAPSPAMANKYTEICQVCHQATGLGVEGAFPPLAGSEWVTGRADIPIAIVLHGLQGEITVKGKKYNGAMTAWGGMMSDDDIAATLTYVRSSWGNRAPAVTPAQVRAVRTKTASRTTPWTPAEVRAMR